MTQEQETREPQSKIERKEPDDFRESLRKTLLLKQFAVRNGYKVPAQLLSQISALELPALNEGEGTVPGKTRGLAPANAKLDSALTSLTSITFPITADNLLEGDPEQYVSFKKTLLWIGLLALCFAVIGLVVAKTEKGWSKEVGCSVLAISLGALGAVVYCFFDALGVVPAQTFSRKDKYPLYARLELGVLLGWVFYFGPAYQAFNDLGGNNSTKSQALYLMIPFIAGYSTKFVVGVLERIMAALLVALGIEGKREARIKRTREAASDGPSS
jgi:hypothetical protein